MKGSVYPPPLSCEPIHSGTKEDGCFFNQSFRFFFSLFFPACEKKARWVLVLLGEEILVSCESVVRFCCKGFIGGFFYGARVSIPLKELDVGELRNLYHVSAVFCCIKRENWISSRLILFLINIFSSFMSGHAACYPLSHCLVCQIHLRTPFLSLCLYFINVHFPVIYICIVSSVWYLCLRSKL